MSHTPGPWEYNRLRVGGPITDGHNFEINTTYYDVATWIDGAGPIRNEDDAILIAAAPDLLKALEDLYSIVVEREQDNDDLKEELDAAEAAITKARGG